MAKNLVPLLTMFLVVIVLFVAFQVVNVLNKEPIPAETQKQIEPLEPTLNTAIFDEIKKKSAN